MTFDHDCANKTCAPLEQAGIEVMAREQKADIRQMSPLGLQEVPKLLHLKPALRAQGVFGKRAQKFSLLERYAGNDAPWWRKVLWGLRIIQPPGLP